tara:strand:+ start:263 stop:469 length:207 start_codon:yes stop_codon:yes gene_type:complete
MTEIGIKDLMTWGGTLVTVAGAFFHLRGRVSVIEALQKRDRETVKEGFRDIKDGLQRIEDKLDHKADK